MFENISKMSNFHYFFSSKEETRFRFSIVVSIENETFFRKQFLSQEGKLCTHFVNEKKWFSGINWFSIQVWSKLSHEKSWEERESEKLLHWKPADGEIWVKAAL